MADFFSRLLADPRKAIDAASITRVDELGNGYDDWNNLIAPKFEAPQQTWGETALGVATAPARMATALAGSLSPYGADGWQVPPIVNEGVNALTAVGDAYNYGMSDDEINSRALGMAGFMMGGGGLAAKSPVSRAANLFPDQPRAMSADLFAEAVPAGERFGARTAAPNPRQSKHWPSWGDREPDRAAAHVREQEAADAWFSIVDPIMYDERGLKRMERHEAEALAIERFPDALDKGFAYKEAAKAWNEIDKGRPMTAAEQAWFDLDLAPGRARTSRNEIMRDIVMPNMIMPDGSTGVQHMAAANGPKKLYSNASKEGAVPAIASALDMSPEARLARAKEMGFDTDKVWHNGSYKKPDAFDLNESNRHHPNPNEPLKATWFSPSENRARWYANSQSKKINDKSRDEVDKKNSEKWFWEQKSEYPQPLPGYVGDYYVNPGRQLEVDASAPDFNYHRTLIDAQRGGYDSLLLRGHLDVPEVINGTPVYLDELAMLNPANIRSVNAAFDPAKSDSANLLAANADSRPALLASALGQEQIDPERIKAAIRNRMRGDK